MPGFQGGGGGQNSNGGGGGGGAGGFGAVGTSAFLSINNGIIQGGAGGSGGAAWGYGQAGSGGDGGVGVFLTQPLSVIVNNGSIVGGSGGAAGTANGSATGAPGQGGVGIMGAGLIVINNGSIQGGMSGDGSTQAPAILFTGGANRLMLAPASIISGNVVVASGAAGTLVLDTPFLDTSTFNVAPIGLQYQGFSAFEKTSRGFTTLVGTTAAITPWRLNEGTLAISSDGSLGAVAGGLTLAGGTLLTTASFASARTLTLIEGKTNTIETASGTALTWNSGIGGAGGLVKTGTGTFLVAGSNSYQGPTTIEAGRFQAAGGNNILSPASAFTVAPGAVLDVGGTAQTIGSLAGGGTVTNSGPALATLTMGGNNNATTFSGSLQNGAAPLAAIKTGAGTMILSGVNSYSGGTTVMGGVLYGNSTSLQGAILNNASVVFDQTSNGTYAGRMTGSGSLTKAGPGTLYVSGDSSYGGATILQEGRLHVTGGNNVLSRNSAFTLAQYAQLDLGGSQTVGSLAGSGTVTSTGTGLSSFTTGANNASTVFDGTLQDGINGGRLALAKAGAGTLNLIGSNTYSGGTTVSGGILQGNSASLQGSIANNSLVVFHQDVVGVSAGALSGTGAVHVRGGGSLTMTGTSTYTGPTTVSGTALIVNGSLASNVTLDTGSTLGGSGTIGGLLANASILRPGNSIGTLTVTGAFAQNGGTYQLEVNGQGQTDRINVGGQASINGVALQVQAASGSYANSTTYTIVNAAGGLSGSYSGTTDNLAFLTPTLSYDGNNAYLTLALQGAPFSGGGSTPNQQSTGGALDRSYANASGDFATVIGALAGLTNAQGVAALEVMSGQPWADVGSMNLAGASMFMNGVMQQMALARGSAAAGGQRQALAQACDVTMCDATSPFSVWGSLMGGAGSVAGNGNASTAIYLQGGAAAGIDYRLDSRFLVGLGVGYSSGSLWVNNFQGKGWNDTIMASLYASFTQGGFYIDALAGYGYASNQMQRQIVIPNLDPRLASGSAGANQFLGQAEVGYQVPVYAPARASVTPFARLQAINVTQNAFSEWGANALSLNVQQQATNALRTTLGAQLEGSLPLGSRSLDLALRLGWQHEFADTDRPITAAFAGAPQASFTVYGASAPRDAAIIGLSAATRIAENASIYLRYDGALASGNDNHALNAGVRFSW